MDIRTYFMGPFIMVVGVHLIINFDAYIMYTYVACDSKSCRITMMLYDVCNEI